jgi:hypothetical protein
MANNVHMSIASWNLALNAAIGAPRASGKIAIYDSTGTGQPATPALGEVTTDEPAGTLVVLPTI